MKRALCCAMLWLTVLPAASGCSGADGVSTQPALQDARLETAGLPTAASVTGQTATPEAFSTAPAATQTPNSAIECFMTSVDAVACPRIVVIKAQRLLELYDGDKVVSRMPVALGSEPSGHKQVEGDGKTPEGVYSICVRNDKSKYHLALGLSYPGIEDATRGLQDGLIDEGQYTSIVDAISTGGRPPWDTKLGGEIMIHGGGSSPDWTGGCIALDDECMDYLWKFVPNGTEVEIQP